MINLYHFIVAASRSVGICPDYVIERAVADGTFLKLKTPFKSPSYRLIAVFLSRQPLGKNAQLLLDCLRKGG
jgi:hypothetical protein